MGLGGIGQIWVYFLNPDQLDQVTAVNEIENQGDASGLWFGAHIFALGDYNSDSVPDVGN